MKFALTLTVATLAAPRCFWLIDAATQIVKAWLYG